MIGKIHLENIMLFIKESLNMHEMKILMSLCLTNYKNVQNVQNVSYTFGKVYKFGP